MSCPSCFSGGISTSHPTGKVATIHGLPTYVSEPDIGVTLRGLIIFITDAFGWEFVNNRVLCDHYAKKGGFLVYCPDFMDGNAMSPEVLPLMDKLMGSASIFETVIYKPVYAYKAMTHAIPWKTKTKPALTHPGIVAFMQALRTTAPPFETSDLKIGVAGFCWGGKHAFMLAADAEETRVVRFGGEGEEKKALVDAVFTAHPSYIEVPADTDAVRVPMSVAVGDEDMVMKAPLVMQMKEGLEGRNAKGKGNGKGGERGQEFEVVVFKGAKHGFAIRTHPEDEEEMKCAQQAEDQALEWFGKWLG